ncbi:MAG: DUF4328 domain-containing protein [Alphaproteobacteria bacterium]|jgi:hypothetical protein|nr:DUF4328 domain-containing protein [Alphaproteobacteria bacterium]
MYRIIDVDGRECEVDLRGFLAAIKGGEISADSMIFDSRENRWIRAADHPDWRAVMDTVDGTASTAKTAPVDRGSGASGPVSDSYGAQPARTLPTSQADVRIVPHEDAPKGHHGEQHADSATSDAVDTGPLSGDNASRTDGRILPVTNGLSPRPAGGPRPPSKDQSVAERNQRDERVAGPIGKEFTSAKEKSVNVTIKDWTEEDRKAVEAANSLRRAFLACIALFSIFYINLILAYLTGQSNERLTEWVERSAVMHVSTGGSFAQYIFLLFSAVIFLFSVYEVRNVVKRHSDDELQWSWGWTVGSIVVPIVSLYRPWLGFGEIYRLSLACSGKIAKFSWLTLSMAIVAILYNFTTFRLDLAVGSRLSEATDQLTQSDVVTLLALAVTQLTVFLFSSVLAYAWLHRATVPLSRLALNR